MADTCCVNAVLNFANAEVLLQICPNRLDNFFRNAVTSVCSGIYNNGIISCHYIAGIDKSQTCSGQITDLV